MRRIKAVFNKEFAHIFRDPTSLTIVLVMPLIMMFIFGYGINFDLNKVEVGIIDYSDGVLSRELINTFRNNSYYDLVDLKHTSLDPVQTGEEWLRSGKLREFIIIPADFSERLRENRQTEIGVIIDGSDSNVANLVYQYNEMVLIDFLAEYRDLSKILKVSTKVYFNPELRSTNFFVPGLVAILLVMISALLTSLSIAREREMGSIDLIFTSPLRSGEIIIGKTLPYIFVALVDASLILLFARFWFRIPFKGDLIVLFVFTLLYIITGLSLGILISTVASSQKTAMFAALLATMLPSILLSGFIFPIASMGVVLRWISRIVPASYFMEIIRGVILKGAEIRHFLHEGIVLAGLSFFLLTVATISFSRNRARSK